ncbi:vesicle transport through interaction with t-SNAREs homolog 1A isoform X5 [Myotis daubentonii]|uniref:vesicle transport through interaction with t-SNAREs homolog 1A isoform X5 n=1 Tax=Myotis daubentonii TaxID=98922 RepID=UPI002873A47B|nr:vesicle transport through interaction with t-SNAREs homolog 1A isoform X5 [Myotis daubentonii]
MSSDFEGFEQDFAVLTAELTSKIARVPRLPPDEKKQMVANVEKQLEEAKELLEQMDLEVREIPPQSRGMYSNRMRSYKQEMGKLETDFPGWELHVGPGSSPGNPPHLGTAYYHGKVNNLVTETRAASPLKTPQPFAYHQAFEDPQLLHTSRPLHIHPDLPVNCPFGIPFCLFLHVIFVLLPNISSWLRGRGRADFCG